MCRPRSTNNSAHQPRTVETSPPFIIASSKGPQEDGQQARRQQSRGMYINQPHSSTHIDSLRVAVYQREPFFSRAIIITDILGSHRKSSSRAPLHCMAVDPDSGLVWEVIGEVINVPTDLTTTTTPWDDGEMRCGSKLLKRNVPRANKLSCLL